MYTKDAEFKAGVVVLLAVSGLLLLLWLASGAESIWAETREVHLRFKQGYTAPKNGDPVMMNGIEIGRIVSVVEREESRTGAQMTPEDRAALRLKPGDAGAAREIYVLAVARLPQGQRIPEGTTAEITLSLTGTRTLALKPGLSTRDLTDDDTRRHPIPAAQSGDLGEILRSIDSLVGKVASVVDRAGGVMDEVKGVVSTLQKKIDAIQIDAIQGNVLDATGSFKETMATLKSRLDEITSKVSEAAADVKAIAADGKSIVKGAGEDVHAILESLKKLALDLQRMIERAAPKVDAILDDLGRASKSIAAFGADAQKFGPQIRSILGEAGSDADRVFDRLKETGQNLVDITEDLRAHPWKLLNKPDTTEIAFEKVRNAAANYVRAATRVEETAEDVRLLLARSDLPEGEAKKLLTDLWARLKADQQKYAAAEQFFQQMLRQGGTVAPPPPATKPK